MRIKFSDFDRIFKILRKSARMRRLKKKYFAKKAEEEPEELTLAFVDIA